MVQVPLRDHVFGDFMTGGRHLKIKHRDRDGGSQSKLIVSFSSGGVAPGVSLLFAFCVFFKALLQSS